MISKLLILGLALCGQALAHGTVTAPHVEEHVQSREAENKQYCYYYSCADCVSQASCGWCASTQTCMGGSSYGPTYGSCSSWNYYSTSCSSDACNVHSSCSTCTASSNCGWCSSTSTCSTGSSYGPNSGSCGSWSYLSSQCSTCNCDYSSDSFYSCPSGYERQGTWCDDKCCGTVFDCCKVSAWAVAVSTIVPLAIIASCIACCCFACTGCPGYNYRMRQQQAQIGYRPPQTMYASRVAAPATQTMPTAVVSAVVVPSAPSVAVPSVQTYSANTTTDSQTVPLVKC